MGVGPGALEVFMMTEENGGNNQGQPSLPPKKNLLQSCLMPETAHSQPSLL